MPRKPYIASSVCPYHLRARSHNKEWFQGPIPLVWEIFCDQLHFVAKSFDMEIIAFVLMNNHYHLLAKTPQANLAEAMNHLQREVSREINRMTGRINQVFGGPYDRSMVSTPEYLFNVYKYIYRNPVDAGICKRVELYPYSTLNGLLGLSKLTIPLVEDSILFADVEDRLAWLNQPFPRQEMREEIRNALRRANFEYGKSRDKKRPDTSIFPEKVRRT